MNPWRHLSRIGTGAALAAVLGFAAFVPSVQAPEAQPASMVAGLGQSAFRDDLDRIGASDPSTHVDAVRKTVLPCLPGTGGDDTPASEQWRMPAGGLPYYINTASFPAGLDRAETVAAIQAAAKAWSDAGSPPLRYEGAVASSSLFRDGKNVISFSVTGIPLVASVAIMRISDGQVTEADIFLDISNLWSTNPGASGDCGGDPLKLDIQNIMAHEFGHWVGVKHTRDAAEVNHRSMFPEVAAGELRKRSLEAGDRASIPSQSAPPSGYDGVVIRGGDDDG